MPHRYSYGDSSGLAKGFAAALAKGCDHARNFAFALVSGEAMEDVDLPFAARNDGSPVESLETRTLLSTTWFVAPGGSDNSAGSIGAPFHSIQKAASVAGSGDTVAIRAGTYHETITPARSGSAGAPITFQAYNGENVIVDGADPVSGWSNYKGSIYKANQSWDLGFGKNQVFVDGKMMIEARWPNTSISAPDYLSKPVLARASGGSSGSLSYPGSLGGISNWAGGTVHVAPGQAWVANIGTISGQSGNKITFGMKDNGQGGTQPGSPFYLTGKFQALDSAGEWFRDPSGALYLWAPGGTSPAGHKVEAKHRQYAFDLSGKSNITIRGVKIFAATINTSGASANVKIDHIDARYLSQFAGAANGWQPPAHSGITLAGPNDSITNSTIEYSAGDGIFLSGHGSIAQNNVIHDVDYSGSDTAGIEAWGSGFTIDHNTIYNAGRDGVKISHAASAKVTYNLIHNVMLQTTDGGGIYTYGTNGSGSVISHNKIYAAHSGGWGSDGIFLDNGCSNYMVDHNIVTDCDTALHMNVPSHNNKIMNNVLQGTTYSVGFGGHPDMTGSQFINNVFSGPKLQITSNAKQSGNTSSGNPAGVFATGATIGAALPVLIP